MLKNKSFKFYLLINLIVTLSSAVWIFFISEIAAYTVLFVGAVNIVSLIMFQHHRANKMNELSNYLRRIIQGDYSLEIRDNTEGELSILKNEIYKVSIRLVEQADILKKEKLFLANSISDISHQLKTPLTSMFVMTDLLGESTLPVEKRIQFTTNIRNQLERIEWLVVSLLKLAKLDAGKIVMKKEVVNVQKMVDRALEHLIIPMELKDQTLTVEGTQDIIFIGDLNWSAEALTNIIKNCIEHTPNNGEIKIKFEDNHIYTRIEVTDTGVGIHKEDLPFIFDRFYKGKNATSDSIGIGLAMAKSLIQKQSGDILIESKLGLGTRFIIKMYKTVV